MELPPIPPDHLISPLGGRVGFYYAPHLGYLMTPPLAWQHDHMLAETGGYVREGRRWRWDDRLAPSLIPCMPVKVLYAPLIAAVNVTRAERMGYTVDA